VHDARADPLVRQAAVQSALPSQLFVVSHCASELAAPLQLGPATSIASDFAESSDRRV
jgi:hypothetical protein